jgi:predicted Rdx family selenoprotein
LNSHGLSEINDARKALAEASKERSRLSADIALSQAAGGGYRKLKAAGPSEAGAEGATNGNRLKIARQREREEKQRLMDAISRSLSENPAEDLRKLKAEYPIVLLPARLETRFSRDTAELLVRIYPDEIAAETHESELTEQELKAGQNYWRLAWNEDKDKEKEAWSILTKQFSAPRCAWIVKTTQPKNLPNRPVGEPVFPEVEIRAQSWTRPAQSRVLPDRWIVIAYKSGDEVHRIVGSPIEEPLALTIDPGADPEEMPDPKGPALDPGVIWTVDFDRAVKAGMALRIPLTEKDLQQGFDRLIALGVKTTMEPDQGRERLKGLLDGHHYSRGLAFLRQGTPTNNTSSAPSGFPPLDPGGSYSFKIERESLLIGKDGNTKDLDGCLFTRALGVPMEVADHIARADAQEQRAARAMNDALWPATFGYLLEAMMGLKGDSLLQARAHFVDYVHGRGPYPAFRIGGTPYGLLPIASFRHSLLDQDSTEVERTISKVLGTTDIRNVWLNGAGKALKVGPSSDPDADLLKILGMDASAQEVRVRAACGKEVVDLLHEKMSYKTGGWVIQRICIIQALNKLLKDTGFPFPSNLPEDCPPKETPELQGMVPLLDITFNDNSYIFKNPLVSQDLSEEKGLDPDYIDKLLEEVGSKTLEEIRMADPSYSHLLYLMLRHSILQEYDSEAFRILVQHKKISENEFRREPERVGFPDTPSLMNAWERLNYNLPELTGNDILWDYLRKNSEAISSYTSSIKYLQPLPSAELNRLFTETLDICSHRLDAWATSLAAKRLDEMREDQPLGSYLGGFAWAEGLMPKPEGDLSPVTLPDGRKAWQQKSNGGYIQAPSMTHASAAAVLRNGFLTNSINGSSSFDVNLSSRRVRNARWVLDSVRQGQFLGAVLGYNLERGLHEKGIETGLGLEVLIDPLRKLYPPPGGSTSDPSEPTESIPARNVVDGLALRRDYEIKIKDATNVTDDNSKKKEAVKKIMDDILAKLTKDGATFVQEIKDKLESYLGALGVELDSLDDLVDSVADLLTAESVYQMIRGNTGAASASLNTMARGARPHDPEILKQPRTGTALTHRVLMVLGGDVLLVDAWHKSPLTPRARAEPYLNRWAGQMMGDPTNVRCWVKYTIPPKDVSLERMVTLSDLRIRPLDFLVLAKKNDSRSELNQRIAEVVLKSIAGARVTEIVFEADESWDRRTVRTFPEVLEVARAVNDVIESTRPLRPQDLIHPSSAADSSKKADLMREEALSRAKDAMNALGSEIIKLKREIEQMETSGGAPKERSDLIDVLKRASLFGLQGAFPITTTLTLPEDSELLSMARRAQKELEERSTLAGGIEAEIIVSSTSDEDVVNGAVEITKAVFGKEFVFLPRFRPGEPDELGTALDYGLKGLMSPDQSKRDNILRKWVQQSSRVRMPLEHWRKLWLYAEALGVPSARIDAAQLPHKEGARWVGLPFAKEEERPASGLLSLVLYRPSVLGLYISPAARDEWVGLALDEWTEIIPSASENMGIAFHFDNPGAEASQAVLIAVPSTESDIWELETLIHTVYDTMDLMRMRLADCEMIDSLAQVLPAIYLASNTDKNAISSELVTLTKKDPVVKIKSDGGP